jgi:hypothetical protein
MKKLELNNETWIDFQARCKWHYWSRDVSDHNCTKGCEDCRGYVCAEYYCPRLKKDLTDQK